MAAGAPAGASWAMCRASGREAPTVAIPTPFSTLRRDAILVPSRSKLFFPLAASLAQAFRRVSQPEKISAQAAITTMMVASALICGSTPSRTLE